MSGINDTDLVREFADQKSEAAFAALVKQHVNLVFATALRQVGDPAVAEEITQNVFVALAKSAGKLSSHPTIASWLHKTTLNKSREWLRSELRRQRREQIAVSLAEAQAEGNSVWAQLVPLLDEALLQMDDADRSAVIMHFMEGRTFNEVGSVLGLKEDATRKRVSRCLEQLTKFFQRRGFATPALSAGAPLFALASHTAPTGLAASATSAGLAAHSTSASTLTLKGALKIMAWTKAKTAVVTTAVVLLAAGSFTPYVWHNHLSPNAWRYRFEATYRLKENEVIRYIKPPFIPERLTYYKTENASQAKAIPRGPDYMALWQKGDKLRWANLGFGSKQRTLQQILEDQLGFRTYEFEDPETLLDLNLTGDWTIREGASREQLLKAFEPVIVKATGRKIHFTKQNVERNVIVAHGTMKGDPYGNRKVQIYAEKTDRYEATTYGGLSDLLGIIGEQLNVYMVNEAQTNSGSFAIAYSSDSNTSKMGNRREELMSKVLKNITDQTGITFTREKRFVDVWHVTEDE